MKNKLVLAAAALAMAASATAAQAQSDILLRLRSGSPPGDRFRVDSAGGVVAIGELGIGIIPASGAGYRMMWYPFKAAFRAGGTDDGGAGNYWDDANIGFYSWAGGNQTIAKAFATFAFGDQVHVTGVDAAGFGASNTVGGTAAFSAGASNHACGFGSVAIGFTNTAGSISPTCSSGGQGAVAIGYRVTADADYAVALGHRASANGHDGVFVAGDQSTTDSIEAVANNEFAARYAGGYRFRTNATLTTGCNLPAGSGVFSCSSSRMLKEHFATVDGEDLLARFRQVPVNTWSYIGEQGGVRHLGPFAEDFRAAFGLGIDSQSIGLLDIAGVNFAAVKALEARTAQLQQELRQRDQRIGELEARLARIEAALAAKPSN
ncbi:MAG TPA: tail fiber domain-containing protein [Longimicrobium sp.]